MEVISQTKKNGNSTTGSSKSSESSRATDNRPMLSAASVGSNAAATGSSSSAVNNDNTTAKTSDLLLVQLPVENEAITATDSAVPCGNEEGKNDSGTASPSVPNPNVNNGQLLLDDAASERTIRRQLSVLKGQQKETPHCAENACKAAEPPLAKIQSESANNVTSSVGKLNPAADIPVAGSVFTPAAEPPELQQLEEGKLVATVTSEIEVQPSSVPEEQQMNPPPLNAPTAKGALLRGGADAAEAAGCNDVDRTAAAGSAASVLHSQSPLAAALPSSSTRLDPAASSKRGVLLSTVESYSEPTGTGKDTDTVKSSSGPNHPAHKLSGAPEETYQPHQEVKGSLEGTDRTCSKTEDRTATQEVTLPVLPLNHADAASSTPSSKPAADQKGSTLLNSRSCSIGDTPTEQTTEERATDGASTVAATARVDTSTATPATATTAPRRQRTSPGRRSRMRKEIADTIGNGNKKNGQHCRTHTPTLEELQKTTFINYVRNVVFPAVSVYELDPNLTPTQRDEFHTTTAMELSEGIAKIRLPDGFCPNAPYGTDRTGRGEAWQEGTELGDRIFSSPIQQNIRGMAGVYEYTHTDLHPCTLAEFREIADQYRKDQMGSVELEFKPRDGGDDDTKTEESNNVSSHEQQQQENADSTDSTTTTTATGELSEAQVDQLERQFWKRLSPTMPPAVYGADEPGTFFGDDAATGWSLAQLDSCLHVLPDIPGVTSPYLYAGMWATVFCAHTEDMNLLSINYLHAGQPKIWYAVSEPDAARFVSLAEHHYVHQLKNCREFLRHKRCLLSPAILKKAGIRYQTAVQYPGDAIITFPGGYHFGFNAGFNIAEATNFGVPEWLPFGRRANVCLCRPDSVRIDMIRLTNLLQKYRKDLKRNRRLTYLQWRHRQERKNAHNPQRQQQQQPKQRRVVIETANEIVEIVSYSNKRKKKRKAKKNLSEQQRKNEFWIEVTQPSSDGSKKALNNNIQRRKQPEVWHLAKPLGRKRLEAQTRVLCLVPAPSKARAPVSSSRNNNNKTVAGNIGDVDDDDSSVEDEPADGEEDEICFSGTVVEVADGHVKIHLDNLPKHEDIWMPDQSTKLFLDGGRWQENDEQAAVPPKFHYWQEMDSKKRARVD